MWTVRWKRKTWRAELHSSVQHREIEFFNSNWVWFEHCFNFRWWMRFAWNCHRLVWRQKVTNFQIRFLVVSSFNYPPNITFFPSVGRDTVVEIADIHVKVSVVWEVKCLALITEKWVKLSLVCSSKASLRRINSRGFCRCFHNENQTCKSWASKECKDKQKKILINLDVDANETSDLNCLQIFADCSQFIKFPSSRGA